MKDEEKQMRPQSLQELTFSKPARLGCAGLCLVLAGLLWWVLVTPPSPEKIFGRYSIQAFVALLVTSYILAWGIYFAVRPEPKYEKLMRCSLTTATLLVLFGLIELPALLGFVDYRRIFLPPFTSIKPWQNPMYQLDSELLWIRRPGQHIVGNSPGDLVQWLGIPTDRRYPFDAQYDSHGFRNDHEIRQAPVVVIGDSMVEWALVPQADLLSTRLSRLLQAEVVNLGQPSYGPQQELVVLRRYGLKRSPKIVLWLFFEGNDLLDVQRYRHFLQDWNATMKESHSFTTRSFTRNALLTLAGVTARKSQRDTDEARRRSCNFLSGQSKEGRTLYFAYPGSPLSREELASLEIAQKIFLEAQNLSANSGAKLLFVYVPTKYRVYCDFCKFPDDGYGKEWHPNDLPSRLESWCKVHGVPFLEATSALKESAAGGELVYFPDDGHLNAKGHEVVANIIVNFLKKNGWPQTFR